MKKISTIWIVLFLFAICGSLIAQGKLGVVGKLYGIQEANDLFGPVLETIEINSDELLSVIDLSDEYVMFTIKDHKLIITNEKRNLLLPEKSLFASQNIDLSSQGIDLLDPDERMYLYSKSKVKEVVELGTETITRIERRKEKLTITNGRNTLQLAIYCPPICF